MTGGTGHMTRRTKHNDRRDPAYDTRGRTHHTRNRTSSWGPYSTTPYIHSPCTSVRHHVTSHLSPHSVTPAFTHLVRSHVTSKSTQRHDYLHTWRPMSCPHGITTTLTHRVRRRVISKPRQRHDSSHTSCPVSRHI